MDEGIAHNVGHLSVDLGDDALADSAAVLVRPVSMLKLQKPCSSGEREVDQGDVDRKHVLEEQWELRRGGLGVKSARCSQTASRTLWPMNIEWSAGGPGIGARSREPGLPSGAARFPHSARAVRERAARPSERGVRRSCPS